MQITITDWITPVVVLLTCVGVGAGLVAAGYYLGRQRVHAWRAALANLPLGVVLYDAKGKRAFENRSADVLLQQFDPTQLEAVRQAAAQGARRGVVVRGREGAVVQVQSGPINARGAEVLVTLRDIAPQQQAEENYRKFIHVLSHELLTPLTAMYGHLKHIESSDIRNEASWRASLRVVQEEVERLTRLISNLLILSRLQAGQPLQKRPTNLNAVAEEVILSLLDKADARQITINLQADPQLARPVIDRDAWKQVLLNLIDNAIKYGRHGGTVNVGLRQEGATLIINVSDDGPGIAATDLPHLFTEMFRAEAQRHVSGSGLGLAIVRRIVEQHGGQITAASELGHGTTFHISLPLDQSDVTTS